MRKQIVLFLILAVIFSFSIVVTAEEQVELEIMAFEGGYGTNWLEDIAESYQDKNPNVSIEIISSPRIWEQLRPRFVSGDHPDLASPGWGFDIWGAIAEDQVLSLNEYLESESYGVDENWKDTFMPGALDAGFYEGDYYIMPLFYNILGWYYEESLFEDNNWSPPSDLDELHALGKEAIQEGKNLFSNPGVYPYYAAWNHFLMYTARLGGTEIIEDIMNLEPGAWEREEVIEAAKIIIEFTDKEYFQSGHVGMDHTEAQMEVLLGNTLLVGAGTWLPNEMAEVTPDEKELLYSPIPEFPDGKGNDIIAASDNSATNWIVPAEAENPDVAIDFLKYMTSLSNAKFIAEQANAITAIQGSEEVIEIPGVNTALDALNSAEKVINLESTAYEWYPELWETLEDNLTSLFLGEITPEEFSVELENVSQETREDDSIIKPSYSASETD